MRKLLSPLLALMLVVVAEKGWPQPTVNVHSQLTFRHITTDNGLSHNRVMSICEDHYGYIWIATILGLNRYDGMEIRTFYADINDSLSLPSNIIYRVFCDTRGRLWIGTNEGLCYYNELNNRFIRFRLEGMSPEFNDVFDITEDGNNNLWFATLNGLYLCQPGSENVVCYNSKSYDQKWILPCDTIYRVFSDNRNNLWLSLLTKGICWIDQENGTVRQFVNIPGNKNSLSENSVEKIFQDSRGDIWIGTLNGGLNLLNPADSSFIRFILDKNDPYSNRVRTIYEDPLGNVFFGTRAGVYLFNRANRNFILYASAAHKFSTLSANSVLCSFVDKKEGLWLGTHYGGVNYSNFGYRPFVAYYAKENDPSYLNNPSVFGINEDSKGNIYVGTEKGINILLNGSSTIEYMVNDPGNENSLSYNDVKSVAIDAKDNLWIATNNGGLNYYDRNSGRFIHYMNKPGDTTSLPSNKVYFVYIDRDKDLWVLTNNSWGSTSSTLSVLKHNENKFRNFYGVFYGNIIENAAGNLYIGGLQGVWILNKQSGMMIYYPSKRIVRVMALHEDSYGNLWVGSESGLSRFNPLTHQYLHYSSTGGYPIYNVYGILSDKSHNLWVSTNAGLIKMNNAVKSIDSVHLQIYNKDDGLPGKEFMTNAFFQNKQGEMFFGTNNGLVRFFPEMIKDNIYKPNIVISELIIGRDLIMPGQKVNRRIILQQPIQKTNSITLDHKTKVFTLKFDALHFANPEKNSYYFRLDNIDTDWKYANAYNNTVTYTSLPKGKYTFTVYASNNDGIYCDNPAVLAIRVLPQFWQTWIFRIALTLLLGSIVLVAFRMRLRKVQSQKKILEKVVRERTAELNKSYLDLKDQKYEILAQNEEIQAQNEEMHNQRDIIERNNALLEEANKNLRLLNEFGRRLTATLDITSIDRLILQYVKSNLNANIFGLGIFDPEKQGITFTDFTEEGIKISDFTSTLDDTTSMGAYCFRKNETILCNDFENEYRNYISKLYIRSTRIPRSVIYIPLVVGTKKIGVFTIQSYAKNAFSEQMIPLVESMASYVAIALDNANVYDIVREQNERLEKKKEFLEYLVKERTRDLERAKNKAEESDRLKSAFLSNMSHEIRTPLNAIIGFIELLNTGSNTPEEVASYHHIIKSSGYTLLQLINDIIDFSKMESGQLEFFISDIKLNNLLADIHKTFIEEIRKNQPQHEQPVELKLCMPSEKQIILQADTVRLQQIFNNLIGNAIKFTTKGTISFGIKDVLPGREIIFFVSDTGIGIEKKNQQLIFNRFVKIDDNKTTLYRGTGLGLTITKHLVETMGGKIWVESEPEKGSEFIFSLPYDGSTDELAYPDKNISFNDEIIPDWSDKHFLIVEDEESNYLVINTLLRKTKVRTSWAKGGEEGINMYQQLMDSINLVLLDIKMPTIDGFQVIREIKEINPSAVVIAQTAYALANEEHMIYKAGFDGYIVKPITLNSLVQVISKFI